MRTTAQKPQKLGRGDTVALVSPSRWESEEVLLKIKEKIEKLGFSVYIHPQNFLRENQTAGTPEQAAQALHDVFQDKNIKAVLCVSGGHGSLHLLDKLDFDVITENPKIFIGYSDATALINSFNTKANIVTFTGLNGYKLLQEDLPPHVLDSFLSVTSGDVYTYDTTHAETLKEGYTTGEILGGNLTLLTNLIGTEDIPSAKGKILLIEDYLLTYRGLDRMLLHLKRSGLLKECAGLIVGELRTDEEDYLNNRNVPFGKSAKDMILDITKDLNIPVLFGVPYGHGNELMTFPLGSKVELDTRNNKKILRLIEPAVS